MSYGNFSDWILVQMLCTPPRQDFRQWNVRRKFRVGSRWYLEWGEQTVEISSHVATRLDQTGSWSMYVIEFYWLTTRTCPVRPIFSFDHTYGSIVTNGLRDSVRRCLHKTICASNEDPRTQDSLYVRGPCTTSAPTGLQLLNAFGLIKLMRWQYIHHVENDGTNCVSHSNTEAHVSWTSTVAYVFSGCMWCTSCLQSGFAGHIFKFGVCLCSSSRQLWVGQSPSGSCVWFLSVRVFGVNFVLSINN